MNKILFPADSKIIFKLFVIIFSISVLLMNSNAQNFTLTISKSGPGTGSVFTIPAGIDCGSTCTYSFPAGTSVSLNALPDFTSSFYLWTGSVISPSNPLNIIMDSNKAINAEFTVNIYSLTVLKTGTGTGNVTSNPPVIDCGPNCTINYPAGSIFTLTATPDAGSVFSGWSGSGCSGTGPCNIFLFSNDTVIATFTCLAPDTPETISGNSQLCPGSTETYSVTNDPLATSYTWSLPLGWTGSSTTNSITTTISGSGTISVTANNSCGSSPAQTLNVTAKELPADFKITNELVAYYPFTGNANDISGNGNDGTVNGATLNSDRFGNANSAYSFNGTSNYVDLGDKDMLNPHRNSITVSAWAKKNTLIQHSRIYSKGTHGGPQPGYDLMFYGSSSPTKAAAIFSAGGHEHIVYSNNPISDLDWHHYVGVINRQGYIHFYIDGVKQNDSVDISAHQNEDIGIGTYNAAIGASYSNFGNPGPVCEFLNGSIDDVRVYMRALTNTEIYALYHPLALYAANDTICENTSTYIKLVNSQSGVSYQLVKNGIDEGSSQTGNGDTLTFNTGNLTSTTPFTIKATNNSTACSITLDSTLSITVNPAYTYTEDYAICEGETYSWHGNDYTSAGAYSANYSSINGCDSIYTLNLKVNPVYSFSENHTICEGETYSWHGNDYSSAGAYTADYSSINGCDSIYTLNLSVNPVYSFIENHTICEGETYTWFGKDFTTAGTYTTNFTTVTGCDSIYKLNLTVNSVDVSLIIIEPTIMANATGATFQWVNCDNAYALLSGETSQSYTASATGTYAVIVTQGSCIDTSACTQIVIDEIASKQQNKVVIYPNPVNDKLIIEINGNTKSTMVEIINSTGNVIFKGNIVDKTVIYTNNFNPGVYLLRINNNKTFKFRKIIKE